MLPGYRRDEHVDCISRLKMYTESDYGGCLYLISLTFRQEEDVSPDDSDNWLHLNVRLQGLMIFYFFTCFNVLMTEGGGS